MYHSAQCRLKRFPGFFKKSIFPAAPSFFGFSRSRNGVMKSGGKQCRYCTVHKKYKRGEDGETREKGEEGVQHDLPLSSSLPYTQGQISEKKLYFKQEMSVSTLPNRFAFLTVEDVICKESNTIKLIYETVPFRISAAAAAAALARGGGRGGKKWRSICRVSSARKKRKGPRKEEKRRQSLKSEIPGIGWGCISLRQC